MNQSIDEIEFEIAQIKYEIIKNKLDLDEIRNEIELMKIMTNEIEKRISKIEKSYWLSDDDDK